MLILKSIIYKDQVKTLGSLLKMIKNYKFGDNFFWKMQPRF